MRFNQGDIVIVPFPFTMGTSSKVRPAIVVSNNDVNSTEDVILAQITSKPRKDIFSFELEEEDLSASLNLRSQVRCHKIFIIQKNTIVKTISKLSDSACLALTEKVKSFLSVKQ